MTGITYDLDERTTLIPAERFLAHQSYRDEWMQARTGLITATTVARAATPAGFREVMEHRQAEDNPFMAFGREAEHDILKAGKPHGVLECGWLIRGEYPLHAATPDGLSPDHRLIGEAKTTGTDWRTIPAQYRRQVQWQLYVTGADRCLFLWDLRLVDDLGGFYRPWLDPKSEWIDRDEEEIERLIGVANRLEEAGYGIE